ncbi:AI-2E family transporter [bacterium]|nr:AI-2E family transporter [bacterium]
MEKRTVNISTGIILKVAAVFLGLWFLYLIRDVIALFFVAILVMAAIEPSVNWLQGRKIPRSLSVLTVYIVLFLILGISASFLAPALISQFKDFSQDLPAYSEKVAGAFSRVKNFTESQGFNFNTQNFLENLSESLSQSSAKIFSTTVGVFSGFLSFVVIFSVAFYMSVKEKGMEKFLKSITPGGYKKQVVSVAEKIKAKIGRWMVGQLFLMFVIFILDFIALYLIGVPYALILAIIGGLLEIIPYLGPIIATILATLVGFLISPAKGLLVLLFYILIQQAENHIITPQIMKKAVGLNPVAVILALLIGVKVAGVLGAILAVPTATAIGVIAEYLIAKKDYAKLAKGK